MSSSSTRPASRDVNAPAQTSATRPVEDGIVVVVVDRKVLGAAFSSVPPPVPQPIITTPSAASVASERTRTRTEPAAHMHQVSRGRRTRFSRGETWLGRSRVLGFADESAILAEHREDFMSLGDAIREAASSSLGVLTCDAAVRKTDGFEAAWSTVQSVPGWFDEVSAATFWGVIVDLKPQTVVEIGSYLGRSTCLIGLALKRFGNEPTLVAIDPHTGDRQNLENLGLTTIPTLDLFRVYTEGAGIRDILDERVMLSDDAAKEWGDRPIDFVFVDGWHSYDAVVSDARNFASRSHAERRRLLRRLRQLRGRARGSARRVSRVELAALRRDPTQGVGRSRACSAAGVGASLELTRPMSVLERSRS